jgi:hypothetical protein
VFEVFPRCSPAGVFFSFVSFGSESYDRVQSKIINSPDIFAFSVHDTGTVSINHFPGIPNDEPDSFVTPQMFFRCHETDLGDFFLNQAQEFELSIWFRGSGEADDEKNRLFLGCESSDVGAGAESF